MRPLIVLSLVVTLFCSSPAFAEAPLILNVQEVPVTDDSGDYVLIQWTVATNVVSTAVAGTFSTSTSNGAITSIPAPEEISTTNSTGGKVFQVKISFGRTDKLIKPDYTQASIVLTPHLADNSDGSPSTILIPVQRLIPVFAALHSSQSVTSLTAENDALKKENGRLTDIVRQFRPAIKWSVTPGDRVLRFNFEPPNSDASVKIIFSGAGDSGNRTISLAKGQPRGETIPVNNAGSPYTVSVTSAETTNDVSRQLVFNPSASQSVRTLVKLRQPDIAFNGLPVPLGDNKVRLPVKVRNVDHFNIQIFRVNQPGQPDTLINEAAPILAKPTAGICADFESDANWCTDTVEITTPPLQSDRQYNLNVTAFSKDELAPPKSLAGTGFKSLSSKIAETISITFDSKGFLFKAPTAGVPATLTIAPSSDDAGNVSRGSTSSAEAIDPQVQITVDSLITAFPTSAAAPSVQPGTAAATPGSKSIRFYAKLLAKDGRTQETTISLSITQPSQKSDSNLQKFITKTREVALGASATSGNNPSIKFNTVGSAIASIISILALL